VRSKKYLIIVSVILLIIVAVILFFVNGKAKRPKFLTDASWSYYDSNIGENLNISFYENGEYIYSCDCGEPVGDSDIYDRYSYNSKDKTIKLSGPDGEASVIKVLYYDEYYLILLFEDGVTTFKNENCLIDDEPISLAADYIEDNMVYLSVLGFDNEKLTVAPYDYDADAAESFAENIFELETNKNVSFYSVSVTIEGENQTVEHFELTETDIPYIGEYYHTAYVGINNSGKVYSVIFYGTLER